uniref:Uncharacterized protein n=1 Tax=Anopheles coluzzii TaxID=1518534 RepID=A0A8W7PGQ9_ANOCL
MATFKSDSISSRTDSGRSKYFESDISETILALYASDKKKIRTAAEKDTMRVGNGCRWEAPAVKKICSSRFRSNRAGNRWPSNRQPTIKAPSTTQIPNENGFSRWRRKSRSRHVVHVVRSEAGVGKGQIELGPPGQRWGAFASYHAHRTVELAHDQIVQQFHQQTGGMVTRNFEDVRELVQPKGEQLVPVDVGQLVGIVAGGAGAVVIAPIEQVPLVREWIRCVQFLDDGSCGFWLGRLERYCDIVKYSVAVEKACKLGSVTGRIYNDDEFGRFSVAFVGIQAFYERPETMFEFRATDFRIVLETPRPLLLGDLYPKVLSPRETARLRRKLGIRLYRHYCTILACGDAWLIALSEFEADSFPMYVLREKAIEATQSIQFAINSPIAGTMKRYFGLYCDTGLWQRQKDRHNLILEGLSLMKETFSEVIFYYEDLHSRVLDDQGIVNYAIVPMPSRSTEPAYNLSVYTQNRYSKEQIFVKLGDLDKVHRLYPNKLTNLHGFLIRIGVDRHTYPYMMIWKKPDMFLGILHIMFREVGVKILNLNYSFFDQHTEIVDADAYFQIRYLSRIIALMSLGRFYKRPNTMAEFKQSGYEFLVHPKQLKAFPLDDFRHMMLSDVQVERNRRVYGMYMHLYYCSMQECSDALLLASPLYQGLAHPFYVLKDKIIPLPYRLQFAKNSPLLATFRRYFGLFYETGLWDFDINRHDELVGLLNSQHPVQFAAEQPIKTATKLKYANVVLLDVTGWEQFAKNSPLAGTISRYISLYYETGLWQYLLTRHYATQLRKAQSADALAEVVFYFDDFKIVWLMVVYGWLISVAVLIMEMLSKKMK